MNIQKRLRDCANGVGNFKTERGDFGLCDDAADEIERLRESHDDMLEVLREVSGDIRLPETQSVSNARDLIGKYNFESKE